MDRGTEEPFLVMGTYCLLRCSDQLKQVPEDLYQKGNLGPPQHAAVIGTGTPPHVPSEPTVQTPFCGAEKTGHTQTFNLYKLNVGETQTKHSLPA